MKLKLTLWLSTLCFSTLTIAQSTAHDVHKVPPINATEQKIVDVYAVDAKGINQKLGTVRIIATKYGLLFQPNLKGLAPGAHGFHVHQLPNCMSADNVAAGAAGTHYDPANTGFHGGPYGDGHLGDLPPLFVDCNGNANNEVLAPRLHTLQEMAGHSIMVHAEGDNFGDNAGGARVACGVIQ